jgi:hypothetical protein
MSTVHAADDPAFSPEVEAMERITPGYYHEWNTRFQQLLDNDQYLKNQMDALGLSVEDGKVCQTYEDGNN